MRLLFEGVFYSNKYGNALSEPGRLAMRRRMVRASCFCRTGCPMRHQSTVWSRDCCCDCRCDRCCDWCCLLSPPTYWNSSIDRQLIPPNCVYLSYPSPSDSALTQLKFNVPELAQPNMFVLCALQLQVLVKRHLEFVNSPC